MFSVDVCSKLLFKGHILFDLAKQEMLLFFSPAVAQQALEVGHVFPVTVSDDDAVRRTEVPYGVLEDVPDDGHPHQEEDRVDTLSALQAPSTPSSRDAELAGLSWRNTQVFHNSRSTRKQFLPYVHFSHGFCKTLLRVD